MRKIESAMLEAIKTRARVWRSGNTAVFFENPGNPNGPRSEVFLYGNHIGSYWHNSGSFEVNDYTLRRWPSVTTKSRLRAFGANVTTHKGVTYLDGVAV